MRKIFCLLIFSALFFLPMQKVNASAPIKILLVPGHDNEVWGAQYGNLKEANMNLALATRIYNLLKKDKRFKVYITRDSSGYTKEFADYFAEQREDILAFKEKAKEKTRDRIAGGDFVERDNVFHNPVTKDISVILYGLNKWADENKIDAVIHIHFNDYPRAQKWTIGEYKGFAIYLPDGQMANWRESGQLAAEIFTQLRKKYIASTYEKELGGLIPDQKLIALGANATLLPEVRSVLVEYGYIYEKKFRKKATRFPAYKNMAQLTVAGIKNYFFGK